MKSRLGLAVAALLCFAAEATASTIVDSINADAPLDAGASWAVPEAGFSYVPASSYTLNGIATKFGDNGCYNPPCYTQTVTIAVYMGLPGSLSLLGSGGIVPVGDTFVTASIPPVSLIAGVTYFVAFENINNIFVNATYSGPISTSLYYDESGDQSFDKGPNGVTVPSFGFVAEFFGDPAAVPLHPLPLLGQLLLFGLGGFGLLAYRRGARKNRFLGAPLRRETRLWWAIKAAARSGPRPAVGGVGVNRKAPIFQCHNSPPLGVQF
jgi:hypothetical protein